MPRPSEETRLCRTWRWALTFNTSLWPHYVITQSVSVCLVKVLRCHALHDRGLVIETLQDTVETLFHAALSV